MKRGLILTAVMVITILVLSAVPACTEPAPAPPSLSVSEIIGNSIDSFKAINSFHFELIHEGGGTPIVMGLELDEAIGDVARPDKLKTAITATMGGMLVSVDVVTIGVTTYMTNPLTKKWELCPGEFSAISIFDPSTGIAAILEDMIDPVKVEDKDNDVSNSYHIKGQIPCESLRPITLSSLEGVNVAVDVWIDKEDFLLNRVILEGRITEKEKPGIIRTLELSNYNQEVEIESPM